MTAEPPAPFSERQGDVAGDTDEDGREGGGTTHCLRERVPEVGGAGGWREGGDGWEETHPNQVLCSHQGNCHEYWESGSKSPRAGGQDPG